MSKVKGGGGGLTTEPTVKGEKDNRTYSSPTVLHKVLAWSLSLCSGRQDDVVRMCQDSGMQRVWVWGCASMTEALDRSTFIHWCL